MIDLDLKNIFQAALGKAHGLSESQLEKFTLSQKKDLENLFENEEKEGHGFLKLVDDEALVKKIQNFVLDQKKENWEAIVVLGIGGSALGLIALQEALLNPYTQTPRLHVVDNVDPVRVNQLMTHLKGVKTLFIVISKSGETVEPMALYAIARQAIEKSHPKTWSKHFVFITDPQKGLLKKIAQKESIVCFNIPPGVGGRFSVLSAVGLLPAALTGMAIQNLLAGAKKMKTLIKKSEGLENPALLLVGSQYLLDLKKGKNITVMMPYSSPLFRMGDWYRQLLAESLGKNLNTGPTPIAALGTTDQHSQMQLYMEGPNNKFLIFITLKNAPNKIKVGQVLPQEMAFLKGKTLHTLLQTAHQGSSQALTQAKRPNITLTLSDLNEENLGALFMLLECQVALLGQAYGVNAFDQPGVEAGKTIAKKLLSK